MPTIRSICLFAAIVVPSLFGQNPAPLLNSPVVPDSAAPGSHGFKLTLNGTGFVSGSSVTWNGGQRTTTFVSASQLTAEILASDIAAAGTASLAVVNPAPGGGTSNVEFFAVSAPSSTVALATSPISPLQNIEDPSVMVAADLNGDRKLDLVLGLASYGGIQVMLGNGDGTFQEPATVPIPGYTYSVVTGDFNGDGKLDLAVGIWAGGGISILLGNGDGTFEPYQSSPITEQDPYRIIAADFNGDGKLDVASVGFTSNTNVCVLLGNGDGTLESSVCYPLGNEAWALVTADFNGDGHLDIATAGVGGISILLGNGDGTFQNPVLMAGSYTDASSLVVADFNGDGIVDLATGGANGIAVLLGKGDGTFHAPVTYPGGDEAIVAADFNGDGKIDLASTAGAPNFGAISILLGNGDGTFQPLVDTAPNLDPSLLALGDFNGDGKLDLASTGLTPASNTSSVTINLQTTVQVSPAIVSFPVTLAGRTSAPRNVTVTNFGSAPLTVTQVGVSGTNPANFPITTDACQGTTLPPAGTCIVGVSFSPGADAEQAFTATLSVSDNASVGTQIAGLEGTGTVLNPTPGQVDFGNVSVGDVSPNWVVRVTNTGTSSTSVDGIKITGADKGDFYEYTTCGKNLNAKASCSVVLQFIPTRKGERKAGLSLGSGNKTVPLSGTGT